MLTRQQRALLRQLSSDDRLLTRHANRACRGKPRRRVRRGELIGDRSVDGDYAQAWSLLPRLIRSVRRGRRLEDAGFVAGLIQGLAIGERGRP